MFFERNGRRPELDPSAVVAPSAHLVGDVRIGRRCYIDHGVILEGSDAPLVLGSEVAVLAGSVVRSVGSGSRPTFPVKVGNHTLIGPSCVLTGCRIGSNCYLASGVTIMPGADVGDDVLLGVGAIVHHHVRLAEGARVGMREIAVLGDGGAVSTGDASAARELLVRSDFFRRVFEEDAERQKELHQRVIDRVLSEALGWIDRPLG